MTTPRFGARSSGFIQRMDLQMLQARERHFKELIAHSSHDYEHLWVASFLYHVTPPMVDGILFDSESMLRGPDLLCYICEQQWEEDVDPVCPGDPNM